MWEKVGTKVNDDAVNVRDTWSSQKITVELGTKAQTQHQHIKQDIIDFAHSHNAEDLPTASTTAKGLVQAGDGFLIDGNGRLSIYGAGNGDMYKSVYDTNNSGVVDNAEKLNGQPASYYLNPANLSSVIPASKIDNSVNTYTLDTIFPTVLNGFNNSALYNPTLGQIALFNRDAITDMVAHKIPSTMEYTSDGTTWNAVDLATRTSFARNICTGNLQNNSGYTITYASAWKGFRLTWNMADFNPSYYILRAFFLVFATNGHSANIILDKSTDGTTWTNIGVYNNQSAWPGAIYMPHANIVANTSNSKYIRFTISPNWNSSYSANNITLFHMKWASLYWGANAAIQPDKVMSWDFDKKTTFFNDIYVNTSKVWHEGNDGSGSTLEADLLDGKHAADLMDRTPTSISTDLNSVTVNGFYLATNTCTNKPLVDSLWYIVLHMGDGTNLMQLAKQVSSNLQFVRTKTGGSWGAWKQIPTMDLVAPAGYGLGIQHSGDTSSLAGIDLNTVNKTGWYYVFNTCTNIPVSASLYLMVQAYSSIYIRQLAVENNTGIIWQRVCSNSTWTGWAKIYPPDWSVILNKPNFADPSWKGVRANRAAVPLSGNTIGDTLVVVDDGDGKGALYVCRATSGVFDVQWGKEGDVDFANPTDWTTIINKPSTFPPSTHTHSSSINFCLTYPYDNQESCRYVMKENRTATDVNVTCKTAPTAAISIIVYQNTTAIATISLSTTSTTFDISPDVSLIAGDVIYAKVNGASNRVENLTVQLNLA